MTWTICTRTMKARSLIKMGMRLKPVCVCVCVSKWKNPKVFTATCHPLSTNPSSEPDPNLCARIRSNTSNIQNFNSAIIVGLKLIINLVNFNQVPRERELLPTI